VAILTGAPSNPVTVSAADRSSNGCQLSTLNPFFTLSRVGQLDQGETNIPLTVCAFSF